jgi:hypothetical protein
MGEYLPKRSYNNDPKYYSLRFIYNYLYFILVCVVLSNILFGIIIDTFSELREKQTQVEMDKQNICFICGANKDDLEKEAINFYQHTKEHHFVWHYVEYIIGLKFVDPQETNAINSYVIEMLESKMISWFPVRIGGEETEKHKGHHGHH